jgi:hypothetical protein
MLGARETDMTTTAHWLHIRLGLPLVEVEEATPAAEPECREADLIAHQRAYAAAPLAVQYTGR